MYFTFILMLHRVPNVSKLPIFEDDKVMLLCQSLQLLAESHGVILLADITKSVELS